MRIGFDLDGVLANFEAAYAPLLSRVTGKNVPSSKPNIWDWDKLYATKEQLSVVWNEIKTNPTFWTTLEPTEFCADSLDYLNKCRAEGDDVYFITTRPGLNSAYQSRVWLEAQGFVDADVYIAGNATEKSQIAQQLGLDFFIDDKPENCEAVSEVVPYTVVLDQPWNRSWDNAKEAIIRVEDPISAVEWARRGMEHR